MARLKPTKSRRKVVSLLTGQGLGQAVRESLSKAGVTTGRDELSVEGRRGTWNYMDDR